VIPAASAATQPGIGAAGLTTVLRAAAAQRQERLAELRAWLAIPSVSADPRRAEAVVRAARWLAAWLSRVGARVELLPVRGGAPVVVGTVAGPPQAPVLLIYGHYDVQPPGPGWTTDPFVPVVRRGSLYARGANDDKGQLFAHLAALAAWCHTVGSPATVVVVADGAEEVGSPGFASAATVLRRQVGPVDAVVISDTERAGADCPSVTVSQRGRLALHVEVDTGGPAVHPGRFGGGVIDPSLVLARVLVELERWSVGWREPVRRPPPVRVTRLSDREIRRRVLGRATEAADLDHRVTLRPAVTVTALRTGSMSTAVAARAAARLDVRLPPGVEPDTAVRQITTCLRDLAPPKTRIVTDVVAAHAGEHLVPAPADREAVGFATKTGFGRPPMYVRSGGSIPTVGVLRRLFDTTPVLLGLGTPAGGAHGPNEHMDLRGWERSIDTCVALIAGMVRARGEWP